MTLTERIAQLFRAPENVESLSDAVSMLDLALTEAKSDAALARQAHISRAIEFVTDPTASAKSQAKVVAAERRVEDVAAALEDRRVRLRAVQTAMSAEDVAKQWHRVESMLTARVERIQRVQTLLDQLAREHAPLKGETDAIWMALPSKSAYRLDDFTAAHVDTCMQIYLAGVSGGRLGHPGINPHVASRRQSLVDAANEISALLMRPAAPAVNAPATT